MTPRAGKAFRPSTPAEELAVTQRHAAGIDVHAAVHFVSVSPQEGFLHQVSELDTLGLDRPETRCRLK